MIWQLTCSEIQEGSIWHSVFVDEMPFVIQAQMGLDIVIRIGSRIPRTSIADFKIDDVIIRRIYELMPISSSSSEAGAHAR